MWGISWQLIAQGKSLQFSLEMYIICIHSDIMLAY